VRKETAVLKHGAKKLLTNGGAGLQESTAIASHNKGVWWALRGMTVYPATKLFVSYNRGFAAAGYAVFGMHRQLCQRSGEVEDARHLRA
jgi:hypothetical protein